MNVLIKVFLLSCIAVFVSVVLARAADAAKADFSYDTPEWKLAKFAYKCGLVGFVGSVVLALVSLVVWIIQA